MIRRIVVGIVLIAVAIVGFMPTMRYFGLVSASDNVAMTNEWKVVRVNHDRHSVVIRVWSCGARFDGVDVMSEGRNVALAVFVRKQEVSGAIDCAAFDSMPTYVVKLDSALPADGRVLESGCPTSLCKPE